MANVRAEYKIEGMNCSHCVTAIRTALDAIPGITAQDIMIGKVRVEFDSTLVNQNAIIAAIANQGYGVDIV